MLILVLVVTRLATCFPLSYVDARYQAVNFSTAAIVKTENIAVQCLQRVTIPEHISQRAILVDCDDLLVAIAERPAYRWHNDVTAPLRWKVDRTQHPPPGEARSRAWVGSQRLCNFVVHPEPLHSWGAYEDIFSIATVLEALRAILQQCANGRIIRNGKQLIGPRRKWAATLLFPDSWPSLPSTEGETFSNGLVG